VRTGEQDGASRELQTKKHGRHKAIKNGSGDDRSHGLTFFVARRRNVARTIRVQRNSSDLGDKLNVSASIDRRKRPYEIHETSRFFDQLTVSGKQAPTLRFAKGLR
jgi:hypothetical protein